MFCFYCGNKISKDSSFCPYCGRKQEMKSYMYCHKCGIKLETDSSYCPYCGIKLNYVPLKEATNKNLCLFPRFNFLTVVRNRFVVWYVLWLLVNCLLLYKSGNAYSDYFNNTYTSPSHWSSSDKGIYPEDWLYPFHNIFNGIMGQDPVYVYDMSEFIIYTIIIPVFIAFLIYKRNILFKSKQKKEITYWTIWYVSIWLLTFFPMGLLGLDFLGWTFSIGGLIVAIFAYLKIKKKCYDKEDI